MWKLGAPLLMGFLSLITISVWSINDASACSFNCDKTPTLNASGFVSKKEALTPYANSYRGETPPLTIPDAQNARIVIWLHGHHNPRRKEKCSKPGNLPPKSILQLDDMANTHVYYHCTQITTRAEKGKNKPDDGIHYAFNYALGSYTLDRRDELESLLDDFITLGVQPKNIVVSGHSAGGWTALLAAAAYPEKFNSLIAFAPAFAGTKADRRQWAHTKIIIAEQERMVATANTVDKLVFAYENDKYNGPAELQFIADFFPDTAQLISRKCANGHMSHRKDCDLDQTINLINGFVFD